MPAWVVWALLAAAFVAGEVFTPGLFFLGFVALAALAATLVALAGGGIALQLVVFIAGTLATIAFVRPIARRHIRMPALTRTGTAALIGGRATVLERVDADGGRVKLNGEVWSARAYLDGQVLEPGARVEVVKIEGATALVME